MRRASRPPPAPRPRPLTQLDMHTETERGGALRESPRAWLIVKRRDFLVALCILQSSCLGPMPRAIDRRVTVVKIHRNPLSHAASTRPGPQEVVQRLLRHTRIRPLPPLPKARASLARHARLCRACPTLRLHRARRRAAVQLVAHLAPEVAQLAAHVEADVIVGIHGLRHRRRWRLGGALRGGVCLVRGA